MSDRKVKGSILVDYARMIKGNSDKDWNKYLKKEDWDVFNQRILPSMWYPFETFQRCGLAAFHLIAGGNIDLVRQWGKISFELLVKKVYKGLQESRDPCQAIQKFAVLRKQLFNFDIFTLEVKKTGDKSVRIIVETDPNEEGSEPYTAQLLGGIERLVELTGGKNPKIDILSKPKPGERLMEFGVSWE